MDVTPYDKIISVQKGDKMLRTSLIIVTLGLTLGLDAAYAQNGQGCQQWCQTNKCAGGMQSGNCLSNCVAACQKMKKK
jgi:hypothetical protein